MTTKREAAIETLQLNALASGHILDDTAASAALDDEPEMWDCGCPMDTGVQQVPMIGTVCTRCGEAVDQ